MSLCCLRLSEGDIIKVLRLSVFTPPPHTHLIHWMKQLEMSGNHDWVAQLKVFSEKASDQSEKQMVQCVEFSTKVTFSPPDVFFVVVVLNLHVTFNYS